MPEVTSTYRVIVYLESDGLASNVDDRDEVRDLVYEVLEGSEEFDQIIEVDVENPE